MIYRRICKYMRIRRMGITLMEESRFDGSECGEEAHEVKEPSPSFKVVVFDITSS